ncbi:MAG TPA: glutamine synthetase III, partial [Longimicrobiales bacterium]|nr:glutamine synthetase III [Longimicrobiales bacterium]
MPRTITPQRFDPLMAVKESPTRTDGAVNRLKIEEIFGHNVFSLARMQARLPKVAYKALLKTLEEGKELDPGIAEAVAVAMKDWALERGAT